MKTTLLLFLLLFGISTYATPDPGDDKRGEVVGIVIDEKLQAPLPYVSVAVKNANGEIISGAITNENGEFAISGLPMGKMVVSVQFIGYKTHTDQIEISSQNKKIDLGKIYLEENVSALGEVVVVAERSTIEQKVDRKVIHVGKDLTTAGATASDIMNKLPSVSMNQRTGEVSLRGNSNVRVMVDGKFSNVPVAQLLKQIPTTSIKSIELITNPSAKYNPEGMSGIINIILYKNTKMGFNGSIDAGLTFTENTDFNGTLNLNYRKGKFNFYGSYGASIENSEVNGSIFRPGNNSLQRIYILEDDDSHLVKAGADFYLNEKNTLSFFTNQSFSDEETSARVDIDYFDNPALNQSQLIIGPEEGMSSQYNFDYLLKFDEEGHEIELEADYNLYDNDESTQNFFTGASPLPDYDEEVGTERERLTLNLDYVNPISENTKLEFGLQGRFFDSNKSYSSTGLSYNSSGNLVPTPSTVFDYSRNIYSAYAIYSRKIDQWSYQVGARLENVKVEADTNSVSAFENDYVQVYPSAYLTYSPSEKNSYQLSYSRRVDRPGLGQVNPIREFVTPLIAKFGNPELEPQFTNSIEANYTRNLKKGSITGSVYYRITDNDISQGFYIDRNNPDRVILTHDNFGDTSSYGLELSANYEIFDWWDFYASFDFYNSTSKGLVEVFADPSNPNINDIRSVSLENENTSYSFKTNHSFMATENLTFSVFGFYQGPEEDVQFKAESMYFVNIGARYSLWDGRGTVSLNYNDVFNTMNFNGSSEQPYVQVLEFNWESNSVYLGFSYRFGGEKYRAKSRRDREDHIDSGGGVF